MRLNAEKKAATGQSGSRFERPVWSDRTFPLCLCRSAFIKLAQAYRARVPYSAVPLRLDIQDAPQRAFSMLPSMVCSLMYDCVVLNLEGVGIEIE